MGAHLIFYRAEFHIFSESEGIETFDTTYWQNVTGGSHHLTCLIQSPTVLPIWHNDALSSRGLRIRIINILNLAELEMIIRL